MDLKHVRWWEWVVIGAALAAVTCFMVSCVSAETDPTPSEPHGGTDHGVLLWHSDNDGTETPAGPLAFLPEWARWSIGVAATLLFPRIRENVAGAAEAMKDGDMKDVGLHLAALTPFAHTPTPKTET